MTRLAAAIALFTTGAAAQPIGPYGIVCNNAATFAAGTGADQQIVAAVPGARVMVCGWAVTTSAATAKTFQLDTGSGVNCATANAVLIPALSFTGAPLVYPGVWASIQTPTGSALCVKATDNTVSGVVFTAQF
jgi:hypothetical protein